MHHSHAQQPKVDLADHSAADQIRGIGVQHFAHKLVARDAGEPVVSALQLEIRVADPSAKHAQKRKTRGTRRAGRLMHFDATVFEAYRDHEPPV